MKTRYIVAAGLVFSELVGVAVVVTGMAAFANAPAGIAALAGRWSGNGQVMPASGPAEAFKCVVTYQANSEGSQMSQALRCDGAKQRFETAARLDIKGQDVSGTWEDKVHSLSGSVRGKLRDGGFDLQLDSQVFQARMQIVTSGCEQKVTVTPVRADVIRQLSATLRKC